MIFENALSNLKAKINSISTQKNVDLLIVSGDVGSAGVESDYEKCKVFLNFLINFKKPIIIVPGNHDLSWNATKIGKDKKKFDDYKEFLKKFIQKIPDVVYNEKEDYCYYRIMDLNLIFVGVNSCKEITYNDTDFALIDGPYLETIKKNILFS